MSYSEKDGQVVLTMSREDYAHLLMLLGEAVANYMVHDCGNVAEDGAFLNRLNQGNPHFTPYQVEAGKQS